MLFTGIILAGEITGLKARIKLMLALNTVKNNDELKTYFDN